MAGYAIITNNPDVHGKYPEIAAYIDGGVMDVFTHVRDAVHLGGKIISHPLSGSVKPNESPYRSVVIVPGAGPVDFKSLHIIEDAVATLARLGKREHNFDESVLADFRIIDLDLMNSVYK